MTKIHLSKGKPSSSEKSLPQVSRYRCGINVDSYPMRYAPEKPSASVKISGGRNAESLSMDLGPLPMKKIGLAPDLAKPAQRRHTHHHLRKYRVAHLTIFQNIPSLLLHPWLLTMCRTVLRIRRMPRLLGLPLSHQVPHQSSVKLFHLRNLSSLLLHPWLPTICQTLLPI